MAYFKVQKSEIINKEKIQKLIEIGSIVSNEEILRILDKAKECKGLELEETAALLSIHDSELLNKLYETAKEVKIKVYGKRVVMFAPLYTSNECINNCLYCGFRRDNKNLPRKTLTLEEILEEADQITSQGHKRILLICGEDPIRTDAKHIENAMREIYKSTKMDVRRINVEAAPMDVEGYKLLKEAGIGTYVIFQETYDRDVYETMHPTGLKKDYDWRITAIDRAFEAGIDDVGIGALFGLTDYRFDVLGLLEHARWFEKRFGIGPHTISVPRLQPAEGWGLNGIPNPVDDESFKKIVAALRVSVPYTGMILSTRESASLRDELLDLGISQLSAGSKTNPGGYAEKKENNGQFELSDHRQMPEVLEAICDKGYIPSFCTACYRRNRTGCNFMEFAKKAEIHDFCQPNAIMTFKENLLDYGNESLRTKGNLIIENALQEIADMKIRNYVIEMLCEIEKGKRDIYL